MFGFHKHTPVAPSTPDPGAQLQYEIDVQTAKLHDASAAVEKAAELMRQYDREKTAIQRDIDILQGRLNKGEDAILRGKLNQRKMTLTEKESAYNSAKTDYDAGQQNLDSFHKAIEQTKQQAAQLNVELDLANANAAGAAFQAQLRGAGSGTVVDATTALKEKIRNTNAHATVDRALGTDPEAGKDDEYLNAGKK